MDQACAERLTSSVVDGILALVPSDWLMSEPSGLDPSTVRAAYRNYLLERLAPPRAFAEEAFRAG